MSVKTERARIIESGSSAVRHSLNQRNMKRVSDAEKRVFRNDKKAIKAEARRLQQEQFLRNFPKYQFDRALGHVFDSTATPEDTNYVLGNIGKYERRVNRFFTEATGADITIVEFTRRDISSPRITNSENG